MPTPYTELFTEGWELLTWMKGDNAAAAAVANSGYKSLSRMHRVVVMVCPVDINDALTVSFLEADNTDGDNPQAFHSDDFSATIATTDTKPTIIEFRTEKLDTNDRKIAINVRATLANTGGNGNEYAILVWGLPRYQPAETTNLDSVID